MKYIVSLIFNFCFILCKGYYLKSNLYSIFGFTCSEHSGQDIQKYLQYL